MTQKLRLFRPLQHGVREADAFGEGHFGAPRGNRKHKGIDFLAAPGERVSCPCDGVIRRIGRCYGDTSTYKLVEIDTGGAWVRVLYVEPDVAPGDRVFNRGTLGHVQDIAARYPPEKLKKRVLAEYFARWGVNSLDDLTPQQLDQLRMNNHVHLDVRLLTKHVLVGRGRSPNEAVWVDPSLFF